MNGFAFDACGLKIGVRVNQEQIVERARAALGGLLTHERTDEAVDQLFSLFIAKPSPRRGVTNFHFLFVGTSQYWKLREIDQALEKLRSSVEAYLAFTSPEHTAVRGLLIERGERIVMLAGKDADERLRETCATESRLLPGKYAVLRRDGQVRPYPDIARSLAIDALIFVDFGAADPMELSRLTPGQTALSLMPSACSLSTSAGSVMSLLRDFSMHANAIRLKCRRADFSVERIFSSIA